jgi:hypothetical protein
MRRFHKQISRQSSKERWRNRVTSVAICLVAFGTTLPLHGLEPLVRDSIRVDGRVVLVDAQVQFDSLNRSKNKGVAADFFRRMYADLSRSSTGISLETHLGVGQGTLEGPSWKGWTGQYDASQSLGLQKPLKSFDARGLKRNGWRFAMDGQVLFLVQQFGGMDLLQIPDSVIGFIPQGERQDWSAVTYKRYSNGIETDTVPMVALRNVVFSTALHLGFSLTHRLGWNVRIYAGAMLNWQSVDRVQLEKPEIGGVPWRLRSADARQILPVTGLEVGRILFESNAWKWSAHGSVKVMPNSIQNHWIGIGLSATVKPEL